MGKSNATISRREFVGGTVVTGIVGAAGCTGQVSTAGGNSSSNSSSENSSANNSYPNQEIRSICPFSAGGGTDRTQRKLVQKAESVTDAEFYTENMTGASGSIGFSKIANSQPNGYTTGVVSPNICVFPFTEVGNVVPKDVTGVMQYNFDAAAVTVHKDAPYDNIDELINYVENGNQIEVGHGGTGSTWHVAAEGFAQKAGIKIQSVSYDGAAPAAKAVMSKEVDATSASAAEVYSNSIKQGGPLKCIAVMGDERDKTLFPNVPTLKEQGVDWSWGAFRGFVFPNGVDDNVVTSLHDMLKKAWETNSFKKFMKNNGFGLKYRGPKEFEKHMEKKKQQAKPIVKRLDI